MLLKRNPKCKHSSVDSFARKNKVSDKIYQCKKCYMSFAGYQSKCVFCGEWATMMISKQKKINKTNLKPKTLDAAPDIETIRVSSGDKHFDGILGGEDGNVGLVMPFCFILAGKPGCGKSSILLKIISSINIDEKLYIATEEDAAKLKKRARRFGLEKELGKIPYIDEKEISKIVEYIKKYDPKFIIFDSLQATEDKLGFLKNEDGKSIKDKNSLEYEIVKILYSCSLRADALKSNREIPRRKDGRIVIIVSQLNKEGDLKGLLAAEHEVDGVAMIDVEGDGDFRKIHFRKNREGPAFKNIYYKMTESGMVPVSEKEFVDGSVKVSKKEEGQSPI